MAGEYSTNYHHPEVGLPSSSSSHGGQSHSHHRSHRQTRLKSSRSYHHYKSRKRDRSEVSCCLKYLIFGSNIICWIFGLCILIIGIWAWTEKDYFNNLSRVTNLTLDPAFVFIVSGCSTFVIGFTGCIGALRENTFLLASYAIFLAILLLFEMTAGILGFIFKDWIKDQATKVFQKLIIFYRDDPDRQNLVDWIQAVWLECCGIDSAKDWDLNKYFNCSSVKYGSREACGVPFSCCKPIPYEIIRNKQCGYDVRKVDFAGPKSEIIYERGCLRAAEEWVDLNLIPVAGFSVAIAVLQILGICFAQNLRADIFAQKAKW